MVRAIAATCVLLEMNTRYVLVTHRAGVAGQVKPLKVFAVTIGGYFTVTEVARNLSGGGSFQFTEELIIASGRWSRELCL